MGLKMSNQEAIRNLIGQWIPQQNETARKLGMTPSGLNQMLSGASLFPFTRFLQLVNLLKPEQDQVDKVFELYLEDLGIPRDVMRLVVTGAKAGDLRSRCHALLDQAPDSALSAILAMLEFSVKNKN